jgi:hypothetical protein
MYPTHLATAIGSGMRAWPKAGQSGMKTWPKQTNESKGQGDSILGFVWAVLKRDSLFTISKKEKNTDLEAAQHHL